jgi:glycosyltransferase involved in cell wall biosynthesis
MGKKYLLIHNLSNQGGAEKQCALIAQNCIIDNIYLLNNPNQYEDLANITKVIFDKKISRFKQLMFGVYRLSKEIDKSDTMISFMELSNFINIFSKIFFTNHKCVISIRISPNYYKSVRFGVIGILLMKLIYPYADIITSNSKESLNQLKKIVKTSRSKFKLINNAINLSKIKYTSTEKKLPDNYLVTIGRLSKQKNIFFQIDIINYLRIKKIKYKLLIIGEGGLKKELIEYALSLGLKVAQELNNISSDIIFLGYKSNPFRFIGNNCIFILSSYYEGMPNVLIEAMAKGTPIISSNCPTGPKELIVNNESFKNERSKYKNGILLPTPKNTKNDISIWGDYVLELMQNKSLRKQISYNARKRVMDFRINTIMTEWKSLINNN